MRQLICVLLLGLVLAGCGAMDESDMGIIKQQIVGGTPTSGDPAVVAIYAKEPNAEGGALCTGTLIAPQVVLTAAHCVDGRVVGNTAEFVVIYDGADLNDAQNRGQVLNVAEVHFDPLFNKNNLPNGHDIGVVILSDPLDVKPIPFMRSPLTSPMKGQPVRIVGYGLNNGFNQQGAGVKREAQVELNSFDEKVVRIGKWGKTICSGDSGGPVLMSVNGQETVIGVNSFGMIFCMAAASSTRVDRYLDFIEPFLN